MSPPSRTDTRAGRVCHPWSPPRAARTNLNSAQGLGLPQSCRSRQRELRLCSGSAAARSSPAEDTPGCHGGTGGWHTGGRWLLWIVTLNWGEHSHGRRSSPSPAEPQELRAEGTQPHLPSSATSPLTFPNLPSCRLWEQLGHLRALCPARAVSPPCACCRKLCALSGDSTGREKLILGETIPGHRWYKQKSLTRTRLTLMSHSLISKSALREFKSGHLDAQKSG